jgi:hypothetical protein
VVGYFVTDLGGTTCPSATGKTKEAGMDLDFLSGLLAKADNTATRRKNKIVKIFLYILQPPGERVKS